MQKRAQDVWMSSIAAMLAAGLSGCCGGSACGTCAGAQCTDPLDPRSASAVIDERGGELSVVGGPSLTIPPGALDAPTLLTIREQTPGSGPGATYLFSPEGQVFARPLDVRFSLPSGTTSAFVYWADGSGGFDPIGGSVEAGAVQARVTHFSSGYVGPPISVRTVTGSRITTNVRTRGINNEPVDLSSETVAALIERTDGGYDTYPGQGHADGTFRIPGVPVGPYLLQVGNRYLQTSEDVVDMGKVVPGRRGLQPIAGGETMLVAFSLTNLAPFVPGTGTTADRIDVVSPDANDWFLGVRPEPAPGATTLVITTDLLTSATRKVPVLALDATAGDELLVLQQHGEVTAAGLPYRALSRVAASGPVSLPGKPAPEVRVALEDVANARHVDVSWSYGAFEQVLLSDAHPLAAYRAGLNDGSNSFRILGQGGGLAYGTHELTGKPEFLSLPIAPGSGVVQSGTMSYGVPGWGDWGAHFVASVDRFVPVDGGTHSFAASLRVMEPIGDAVTLMAPKLGLARHPKVNGRDLFAPQQAVGLTPTISWDEPSPGPADAYMLQIVQLGGSGQPVVYAAFIDTKSTSVRLPPGVLVPGQAYVAWIRSYLRTIREVAPLRVYLPLHQSVQVTDSFRP